MEASAAPNPLPEWEFFIDNLLVRIHLIIVMIRWTGLTPLGSKNPGSFTSTFLEVRLHLIWRHSKTPLELVRARPCRTVSERTPSIWNRHVVACHF